MTDNGFTLKRFDGHSTPEDETLPEKYNAAAAEEEMKDENALHPRDP